MPRARSCRMSGRSLLGSPPPPRQPPLQAITSIATCRRHASEGSRSISCAAAMELATATVPTPGTVATLTPLATPRHASHSRGAASSPRMCVAVRSAASITPPLAPKITAAPVDSPRGESNCASLGRDAKGMRRWRIMRASSRVVMAASTSPRMPGRTASSFLAVQGMTDTTNGSSSDSGSGPSAEAAARRWRWTKSAKGPRLAAAACICWGLLVVDRCGMRSGRWIST
mmetsp:Transcript_10557/g.35821  ORF Transcript_10557/g.35821 Transcript_10557/m.35821 type:complete len:229 (+) Transcript_10557:90-776(+)